MTVRGDIARFMSAAVKGVSLSGDTPMSRPSAPPAAVVGAGGTWYRVKPCPVPLRVPGAFLRGSAVPVSSLREGEPLSLSPIAL